MVLALQKSQCGEYLLALTQPSVLKYLKEIHGFKYYTGSKDYLASVITLIRACPALEIVCLEVSLCF